jgi:hypothetical protein
VVRLLLSHVRLTSDALSRVEFVLAAAAIVLGLAYWTWRILAVHTRKPRIG